jgi:hypothetical protein
MAVTGTVHPGRIVSNAGARPGDALVLTKPIGTGILASALKKGAIDEAQIAEAVRWMTRLNAAASAAMLAAGAHAATDVTGFGLLGHAGEIARASGVRLRLSAKLVPVYELARAMLARDIAPGGSRANAAEHATFTEFASGVSDADRLIFSDAQTSGGLLVAVPPDGLPRLLEALRASGDLDRRRRAGHRDRRRSLDGRRLRVDLDAVAVRIAHAADVDRARTGGLVHDRHAGRAQAREPRVDVGFRRDAEAEMERTAHRRFAAREHEKEAGLTDRERRLAPVDRQTERVAIEAFGDVEIAHVEVEVHQRERGRGLHQKHNFTRARYVSVVFESAGTVRCHVAVALDVLRCGTFSERIVHSPGIGSTTSTSCGTVFAFATRTS